MAERLWPVDLLSDREVRLLVGVVFGGSLDAVGEWLRGEADPDPFAVAAGDAEAAALLDRLYRRACRRALLGAGRPRSRPRRTFAERKRARVAAAEERRVVPPPSAVREPEPVPAAQPPRPPVLRVIEGRSQRTGRAEAQPEPPAEVGSPAWRRAREQPVLRLPEVF